MGVGALAYISAVSQRSTMGVASLDAAHRFHTNAEQLSALAVAQLFVYAAMQIPVGLLLDKFGARLMLSFGAFIMAAGQLCVAYSTSLAFGVAGRMLVGFGDAFTFISLLRLINAFYEGKRASQLQQWLGNGGQIGQIVSAFPFAYLLRASGWVNAFTVWATVAAIIGVACWLLIASESHRVDTQSLGLSSRLKMLKQSLALPSTRMAFWVHFTTQSSTTSLVLLWGVPFLVEGEGVAPPVALAILSSFVVIGFGAGIALGQLCAYRPTWRRPAITITASSMLIAWSLLLAWPGKAPTWVLGVWLVAIALNAPASMVAMDYTRQYVPRDRLGSVNGFVNIGGFSATFTMMFLIGLGLDIHHRFTAKAGEPLYSLTGFRLAFISVLIVVGLGLFSYLKNERLTGRTSAAGE
jgi:MFS family permease